jgi:hypothetical protein
MATSFAETKASSGGRVGNEGTNTSGMRWWTLKRIALAIVIVGVWVVPRASGQNLCSTTDVNKVACTVANVYGVDGLSNGGALAAHGSHQGHFADSFLSNLSALNSSIGSQLGVLPLVSPSSGIAFSFDKSLGVFVPSEYNLGPILSERAGTIGRHKLLFGFSYQAFDFDTLDGMDLKKLPAVFTHENYQPNTTAPICSVNGNPPVADATLNEGQCAFVRDTIVTLNNINLRVNQYTAFFSFGLTDRLDISVAIPTVNVRMSATSAATIHNNGSDDNHQFTDPSTGLACSPNPCFNRTFFNSKGATGIGDVTVRAKYEIWKGERAGFAVGGDLRFPSGDSLNYLGSGAYGIKPFGALSYSFKRLSTHVNAGYEWNGSSFLAGNIAPSQTLGTVAPSKDNLPGQFFYSAGAEVGVLKRLSAAFDFLGQEFINAPRIAPNTYPELPACTLPAPQPSCGPGAGAFNATGATDPDFRAFKASYSTAAAAVGLRFRPFRKLLLTANVVTKLNDPGLRSKFIPLLGISYSH